MKVGKIDYQGSGDVVKGAETLSGKGGGELSGKCRHISICCNTSPYPDRAGPSILRMWVVLSRRVFP